MAQKSLIKLQCVDCKKINYWSRKNKKTITEKLEFKKYCKWCRKHTLHRETKK